VRELLGRADVDGLAGQLLDARLERRDVGLDLLRQAAQVGDVDPDPDTLDPGEQARQRQLEIAVEVAQAGLAEAGVQGCRPAS
jgi:hypothetical protein